MSSEKQYIDFYREVCDTIIGRSCAVMNDCRDTALTTFKEKGFPSKKDERYKYTNVEADFTPEYGIQLGSKIQSGSEYCTSIQDAPIDVSPYYNKIADTTDPIVALNTVLTVDTLVVYIPRDTQPKHPIQINNVLKGNQDTMVNRRMLIILAQGSQADIIITDHAASDNHFLTNQVIEVITEDNARLNLYDIEETHLVCTRYSNVYIRQGRDSNINHTVLTIFNGHTRNTCTVNLAGEGSGVSLNGCVIADKMQRVDNNTLIRHLVPHCTSDELYKYVLDDNATGAFAGLVYVKEGAQQTNSAMTNANLCMSPSSHIYTQPMLEIYADDVKCSHGSTVGQLNEQQLFYMRQRGISEQEARMLLKSAFITHVIETIPLEALRDRLHYIVDKRLRGELSKCEGCKMCK